jgi:hypothetical protein
MLRSACFEVEVSVLLNGAQGRQDFCQNPTGEVIFPAVLHGEIHPGPSDRASRGQSTNIDRLPASRTP